MIVLEPRRIKDRLIKHQQKNKRLLMENEVLYYHYLAINNRWDFYLDAKYIKCKKIIGNVSLLSNHIPSWIRNIEIDGYFNCSGCILKNLDNCPKIIHGSFWCNNNELNSLEDGPTFVGANYRCNNNSVKFTKEYVKSICQVNCGIYE